MSAPDDKRRPATEKSGQTIVTTSSDREIVITRAFDAPRTLVFDAWTKAEHIAQWWDPSGTPLALCEIDLRPGGAFRFVPQGPDGPTHSFAGVYRDIAPPARLVFTTRSPLPAAESVATLLFSQQEGRTTLTITMACDSMADRDALLSMRVDVGTTRTLDNLDGYLRTIGARPQS